MMMKSTKRTCVFLFLTIFMLGLSTTRPIIAGEAEKTEGMIYAGIYYNEAGRYLSLGVTMRSSTGEFNDRIYFTINETEYTMDPFKYTGETGEDLNYNYWLSGLNYGTYEIKFFHENSTDIYEYETIFTANITEYEFHVEENTHFGYTRIGNTNNMSFYAYWDNEVLTEEIENIQLILNGTSHPMSWHECSKRFLFNLDFGIHNSNTYNYSISFSMGNENFQTENKTLTSSNNKEISFLSGSLYPLYTPDSLDFNVKVSYSTWQNVEPILKLEIDGLNQTIEPKFDLQSMFQGDQISSVDWTSTQQLGMYNISGLEEGTNHSIKVHAFDDSKWLTDDLMDNETLSTPPVNEDFTIDILNWGFTPTDWYTTLHIDINVTCPYLTNAYERNEASLSLYGPMLNNFIFQGMGEDDYNDADYSDGKIYNFSYNFWNAEEVYGEFTGKFHIFYKNQTTTTTYGHYISSNNTFSISETPVAEFGINKEDWFLYESGYESTYRDCDYCNLKGVSYYIYRIADFGYELGVNYLDLEYYEWDKCNEKWVYDFPNYDYLKPYYYEHDSFPTNVNNASMRIWINLNDNSSLDDWTFLPLNNISDYLEDCSRLYFEDNKDISRTSVEFSAKLGDIKFNGLLDIDRKGFLIESSSQWEYGKYFTYKDYVKLINSGNGDIPETIKEKSTAGGSITVILLVLAISIAGVVITYRSERFPNFNRFIEKLKK
nr:hypothetical protein DSAG12_02986 [Candidatus Prometheoarchaeum syntrophicum]